MISKSDYRMFKLYNEKRFYKKSLLEIYEKFKNIDMDKDMIPLCDYINYNCKNINSIFSCTGHLGEKTDINGEHIDKIGYITLKYRNIKDIALILPLLPNEYIDNYIIHNSRNWLSIYFKSKNFKNIEIILFEIFREYENILIKDSLFRYGIDENNNIKDCFVDIFYWLNDEEKQKIYNRYKNGEINGENK